MSAIRRSRLGLRDRGDGGFVIIYVALLLVFLLVVAAIVIDLGNARQANREARAAADAGALAGAQAMNPGYVMPGACSAAGAPNDLNCLAAYHTFVSSNVHPDSTIMTSRSNACSVSGQTCYRYTSNGVTVEVTSPYMLPNGGSADSSLMHVQVCWNVATSFARVIGTNSIKVCGSATAKNSPPQPGQQLPTTPDCSVEDNFADINDAPQIYVFDPGDPKPNNGTATDKYPRTAPYPGSNGFGDDLTIAAGKKTAKANEVLAVIFDGHGTEINRSKITFMAPTTATGNQSPVVNGNLAKLPDETSVVTNDNLGPENANAHGKGFVLQSLDTSGTVHKYDTTTYPASAGNRTLISYQLPDDAHLNVKGYTGGDYTFTATLHVEDSDNTANPATRCGNASWVFTHDGKNVSNGGSTCGENSFYGFAALPSGGVIDGSDPSTLTLQAFFTDESPMQYRDFSDTYWQSQPGDYGVDFTYVGSDGVVNRIKPSTNNVKPAFWVPTMMIPYGDDYVTGSSTPGGYYFKDPSDPAYKKDTYYTTVKWNASALANGNYTIRLKLFDTDNNKPGNDCGIMTWTVTVKNSGVSGSGLPGDVKLVE